MALATTPGATLAGWMGHVQAFFGERSQGQRLRCAPPFRSSRLPGRSAQRCGKRPAQRKLVQNTGAPPEARFAGTRARALPELVQPRDPHFLTSWKRLR